MDQPTDQTSEVASDALGEPIEVRAGEELDRDKIYAFIRAAIPGMRGEFGLTQFPSGWSNLTYLLKIGEREFVLRRPPIGKKAKTAHDMSREYRVLKAIKPHYRYCPEALLYTEDASIIGCPFFVMERLHGIVPKTELPKGIRIPPNQARALSENFIKAFAELHLIDYQKAGLGDFGKPQGYVRRQVEGWSQRYRDARTDDAPRLEEVMRWLHDKMPPESGRVCVIHNDYKLNNALLNPQTPAEITGILDWEMATIGDPLMDLGSLLVYWVERDDPFPFQSTRQSITHLEGMLTRKELVQCYSEQTGIAVGSIDFYFCFAIFRLAVLVQQMYYRYYHGQTKDDRFSTLVNKVHEFEQIARVIINTPSQ
jgi:aminoglycoside phosphotransferase (APT) family kinase protein